jgi:hypothetical protein
MKIALPVLISALVFLSFRAGAQADQNTLALRDSLSRMSSRIWNQRSDTASLRANNEFLEVFGKVLQEGINAVAAPDSVFGITCAHSPDGKLTLYTWNIPLHDGTNTYFGFIRSNLGKPELIPLKSTDAEPANLDFEQLTPDKWYGAVYYRIVDTEIGGKKVYTLLGWDGYTAYSNRKFIDIYSLDPTGNPVFGLPVFKTAQGQKNRVILEYAEKANLAMRYDYQTLRIQNGKKIRKTDAWLIVMDHLIPMDPSFAGMPKYYVPSGDSYDGYLLKDGYWCLVEDVEVKSRKTP